MTARSGPESDPLAAGDAIAVDLLAGLEPLRFREAGDERERREAFGLRYRAVIERAMAPAERFPDGLEHDELDASAVHLLAWDGARPVATCRLVLPSPGRALPVEQAFGLRLDGTDRMVEVGRLVVDPGYRGDGHSIFMGLAARSWLSMRCRGFTAALAATTGRLVALFEALGFTVTILGPPRTFWGEERYPLLCDGRAAIPGLERRWADDRR